MTNQDQVQRYTADGVEKEDSGELVQWADYQWLEREVISLRAEIKLLVDFSRDEAEEAGRNGDYNLWTPAQTAIHEIKRLSLTPAQRKPGHPMLEGGVQIGIINEK